MRAGRASVVNSSLRKGATKNFGEKKRGSDLWDVDEFVIDENEDVDELESGPKGCCRRATSGVCSCCSRMAHGFCFMFSLCFPSLPQRGGDEQEDDSDTEGDISHTLSKDDWGHQKLVRRLDPAKVKQIERAVREELEYPDENEPWPWHLTLQRVTGILRLRFVIRVKRARVAREMPACPVAQEIAQTRKFEVVIGILIVLNAINIGADAMKPDGELRSAIIFYLENAFTALFVVEWFMRIFAYSWVWIFEPMNFFDTLIVWCTGVLVTWILVPAGLEVNTFRRIAALRVLRLGRMIRTIRIIPQFRELWILVNGILGCVRLIFWACVIMFVSLYTFSIFFVETVAKSDTFIDDALVQEHFGSIEDAMFTLFQIMLLDGWSIIIRHILAKMPETAFLIFLFLGIGSIVIVNLITAIVVMQAIVDAPKRDKEALGHKIELDNNKLKTQLKHVFEDLDTDGSGTLTQEEFMATIGDKEAINLLTQINVDPEDVADCWYILMDNDHGELKYEDFISGFMKMRGAALARDMLKARTRMETLVDGKKDGQSKGDGGFREVQENVKDITEDVLENVLDDLMCVHEDFMKMQMLLPQTLRQLDEVGLNTILCAVEMDLPSVQEPTEADLQARAAAAAAKQMQAPKSSRAEQVPGPSPKHKFVKKVLPTAWVTRRKQQGMKKPRKVVSPMACTTPTALPSSPIHEEHGDEWKECELAVPEVPPPSSTTMRATAIAYKGVGPALARGTARHVWGMPSAMVPPASSPSSKAGSKVASFPSEEIEQQQEKSQGSKAGSKTTPQSLEQSHPHVPADELS